MRGERCHDYPFLAAKFGSSPHARGTRTLWRSACMRTRFIPACAGNAWSEPRHVGRGSVHPRMRGERPSRSVPVSAIVGSSPHARGTRPACWPSSALRRFIPACAGNACCCGAGSRTIPVHPRMRGERRSPIQTTPARPGSSPHARGTLLACLAGRPVVRFIPACAGNAQRRSSTTNGHPVHPRMRGERCSASHSA